MRVFHTGAATCTNHSELCCILDAPETHWVNIWSLTNGREDSLYPVGSNPDHLLTVDENERNVLVSKGWEEICSPAGGATAFCKYANRGMAPTARTYATGPFLAYAGDGQEIQGMTTHGARDKTTSGRSPVHRCITESGHHFISG